mmetsp:Transcript_33957/g.69428  ORF Transcript_33957/g.69428 Transcript_33957/m.69428 type:complete len:332 (-) Transcript_33957:849-1844(-)
MPDGTHPPLIEHRRFTTPHAQANICVPWSLLGHAGQHGVAAWPFLFVTTAKRSLQVTPGITGRQALRVPRHREVLQPSSLDLLANEPLHLFALRKPHGERYEAARASVPGRADVREDETGRVEGQRDRLGEPHDPELQQTVRPVRQLGGLPRRHPKPNAQPQEQARPRAHENFAARGCQSAALVEHRVAGVRCFAFVVDQARLREQVVADLLDEGGGHGDEQGGDEDFGDGVQVPHKHHEGGAEEAGGDGGGESSLPLGLVERVERVTEQHYPQRVVVGREVGQVAPVASVEQGEEPCHEPRANRAAVEEGKLLDVEPADLELQSRVAARA